MCVTSTLASVLQLRRAPGAMAGQIIPPPSIIQSNMGLDSMGLVGLAPASMTSSQPLSTRVLRLTHMVTDSELRDDKEYADILQGKLPLHTLPCFNHIIIADVSDELRNYGKLSAIVIPRKGPEVCYII
jgi:hypothetical protein